MKALSVIFLLVFVAIACDASADVTGVGSISLSVPVGTVFTYSPSTYAGQIRQDIFNSQTLFLVSNNGTYDGSLTDNFNSISASVNQVTGNISGDVTAKSNIPDSNHTGVAELDVRNIFTYTGIISSLPLSFSFSGQKDSLVDLLVFRVQTEVFLNNVSIYSDYTGGKQPVEFYVTDLNPFSIISGFDYPVSSTSENDIWRVFFQLEIYAWDSADQNQVPIPPSILLLGSGLLGLTGFGIRRKFKG